MIYFIAALLAIQLPSTAPSVHFKAALDGRPLDVHEARVAVENDALRWKEMDDLTATDGLFETAAFANVDLPHPGTVRIETDCDLKAVKVLPAALNIRPTIDGRSISFGVALPGRFTVEVNGDFIHSFHLFINPPSNPPPRTRNVIHFDAGVHEIREPIEVTDHQTVYLADGAILQSVGSGGALLHLHGDGIKVYGRGILDGTRTPVHGRVLIRAEECHDLSIEGITLHDSPGWNLELRRCDHVAIDNVKIIGHRSNSDGIDICNSRDVTVQDCFMRTLDDLIVVKTDHGQGPTERVKVRRCVLWNQVAHALSIGAEIREAVSDVLFEDCDVIHDIGREWTLRVFHSDSAWVRHVRFSNIRIEQSRLLISLWIGKSGWTFDADRGHIEDVAFDHITAIGDPAKVELIGFDASHAIDGVQFDHVMINGKPLSIDGIVRNDFVRDLKVQ